MGSRHSPAGARPGRVRPGIDRRALVGAALELLDEGGIDALTMRRLGDKLGIQAPSLYNHVRGKDELLALVADAIGGEVRAPDARRPWREQLETLARAHRRALLARRDAARVLMATPPAGPHRLERIEHVLATLRRSGLADADVADAAYALNTYVTGFVLDETQQADPAPAASRAEMKRGLRRIAGERYPTVHALASHMVDASLDRRFEFGLRAILDGIEARVRRPSRRESGRRAPS